MYEPATDPVTGHSGAKVVAMPWAAVRCGVESARQTHNAKELEPPRTNDRRLQRKGN